MLLFVDILFTERSMNEAGFEKPGSLDGLFGGIYGMLDLPFTFVFFCLHEEMHNPVFVHLALAFVK